MAHNTKHGKKYRQAAALIEEGKSYNPQEGVGLIKKVSTTNFDGTIELHMRLGVDPDRVVRSLQLNGNTVSASIPMTLHRALGDGRLSPGDLVLLCGFGAGLSWGSALVRW